MQYTESILLSRLLSGPRSEFSLTGNDSLAKHVPGYLSNLQMRGLAVLNNEHWHITEHGKKALEEYKRPARKTKPQKRDSYDGAELRHRVMRDGAYDFLSCPSKMGKTLVYRKDAV